MFPFRRDCAAPLPPRPPNPPNPPGPPPKPPRSPRPPNPPNPPPSSWPRKPPPSPIPKPMPRAISIIRSRNLGSLQSPESIVAEGFPEITSRSELSPRTGAGDSAAAAAASAAPLTPPAISTSWKRPPAPPFSCPRAPPSAGRARSPAFRAGRASVVCGDAAGARSERRRVTTRLRLDSDCGFTPSTVAAWNPVISTTSR